MKTRKNITLSRKNMTLSHKKNQTAKTIKRVFSKKDFKKSKHSNFIC